MNSEDPVMIELSGSKFGINFCGVIDAKLILASLKSQVDCQEMNRRIFHGLFLRWFIQLV